MFNVRMRRVGGIWFLQVGRINLSFSVTTPGTWERRQEARVAEQAERAAELALAVFDERALLMEVA